MVAATTSIVDSASSAFERLFAGEYARVVSIAVRITSDVEEARDVAQETFVRFARSCDAADPRARPWLYTTAVRRALNAVRSRRRRRTYEAGAPAFSAADDPQDIIEREFDRARVRAALVRMNTRDAELLALRYGGLSYREVAETLGIDAAQVGTRLARAERAFRKELEREAS